MPKKEKIGVCTYCGCEGIITPDHIPPKCIYVPIIPQDAITVPSCIKCNQKFSLNDERFKVCVQLAIAYDHPLINELWKASFKTLLHTPSLFNKLFESSQEVFLTTPSGIIYGKTDAYTIKSDTWDEIIISTTKRIILGLYHYHFNSRIADSVNISLTGIHEELNDNLLKFESHCEHNIIGNQLFEYKYAIIENNPLYSLWIMRFYKSFITGGYTRPIHKKIPYILQTYH